MKPIYFPFTYISEPVTEALASCFKQIIVYQAMSENLPESMKKWAEKGILDIRTPVKTDEQKLDAIVKEYKNWSAFHQGTDMAFFKTHKDKIPFFDSTSQSQIRAEIKKRRMAESTEEKTDPLLNARIFLQIAQEFDIQQWEIHQELDIFGKMEQNLMKSLRDEEPELHIQNPEIRIPDDSGNYMTSERIGAWTYLMQHDPDSSKIFITSSSSVLDNLIDKSPADMRMILQLDALPVVNDNENSSLNSFQNKLMECLDNFIKNPECSDAVSSPEISMSVNEKHNTEISLKFYLVQGKTTEEFFAPYISSASGKQGVERENKGKNILIGLAKF